MAKNIPNRPSKWICNGLHTLTTIDLDVVFSSDALIPKGMSNGLGDRRMGEVAGDGVGVGPRVF